MASKYLEILADIKSKMESIADIGWVYDYERWSADWGKFLNLFKININNTEQIRGWEITRIAVTEHNRGAYFRHHKFRINGYMSLRDDIATDKTFQELIEEICITFRAANSPDEAWFYIDGETPESSPIQVITIEARTFGGVLCHYAEIMLTVTERII